MENSANVNDLKEALRYVEQETENLTRYLTESKRLSTVEPTKIFPFGLFILLLGVVLTFLTYWLYAHQYNVFVFSLSLVFAVISLYEGIKLSLFGLKLQRIDRQVKIALQNAREYKKELEQKIAECH